jgi:hypothetical protein
LFGCDGQDPVWLNEIAPFPITGLNVVYSHRPNPEAPNYACLFLAFGGQHELSSGDQPFLDHWLVADGNLLCSGSGCLFP